MTPIAQVVDGKPELTKQMPHGVYIASTVTKEVFGPFETLEKALEWAKK
jgi:hypothetical protein